jgi:hypothetical protein
VTAAQHFFPFLFQAFVCLGRLEPRQGVFHYRHYGGVYSISANLVGVVFLLLRFSVVSGDTTIIGAFGTHAILCITVGYAFPL